ncbi:MAG: transglutaminaseTgpA domain-containing protein [Micrococcales bacterium]|nr:transglutaminaseTgpA domain-containing protein [Micrococcales bacterium]
MSLVAPAGPRAWDWARAAQTMLVATAVTGAFTALSAVLAPGRWTGAVVGVVTLVTLVLVVVRLVFPLPGVAPGVAVAFATWLVVAVFSDPDQVHVLPGGGTFDQLSETLQAGAHEIWVGKPPLPAGPGVVLFLVGGAAALLVFCDLCISVDVPVVSGFALLTPWLPGMVLGHPASLWSLVLTAVPWLVLLADVGQLTWPRRATVATCSAAAVAAALVLTPAFSLLPGWGRALDLLPFSKSVMLSEDLDLRDNLTMQSGNVAFRYTVAGASPSELGPLRVFTTTTFDGTRWTTPRPTGTERPAVLGEQTEGSPTVVEVEIVGWSANYLPITASARSLELNRRWWYDAEIDAVWLPDRTTKGMSYTMMTSVPDWTDDQLRAASTSGGPPEALDVPPTAHKADIAEVASQVTDGAGTAYDQALALQTWFRSTGGFVYDTTAPQEGDDVVWSFLQGKQGYCVHYATTMVVMARTLGVPARLAAGFLPGRTTADGVEVAGRNAHAWPELWFDDVGWVRFEPTPSLQTGPPPPWAPSPADSPAGPGVPPPVDPTAETTTAAPTPEPTAPPTAAPPGALDEPATNQGHDSVWVVWLLVAVAMVGAVVALVFVMLRRARAAPSDPEQAWVRVRQAFTRAHMGWSESTTPRQVLALPLERLVPADPADDAVRLALHALATTLESLRYARPGAPAADPAQVVAWVTTIETNLRRHR